LVRPLVVQGQDIGSLRKSKTRLAPSATSALIPFVKIGTAKSRRQLAAISKLEF
jgi:hypothetical protein